MSEKAKLLAHFSTKLSTALSEFNSDRFQNEMQQRIQASKKFCENDPTKIWWFKDGTSKLVRFKIVIYDDKTGTRAERYLEARPQFIGNQIDQSKKVTFSIKSVKSETGTLELGLNTEFVFDNTVLITKESTMDRRGISLTIYDKVAKKTRIKKYMFSSVYRLAFFKELLSI